MKFLHYVFNMCAAVGVGIFGAYVFSVMWAWFVVPLGGPALTVAMAGGLMIIAGYPTAARAVNEIVDRHFDTDAVKKAASGLDSDVVERIKGSVRVLAVLVGSSIALLVAYLWSLFL